MNEGDKRVLIHNCRDLPGRCVAEQAIVHQKNLFFHRGEEMVEIKTISGTCQKAKGGDPDRCNYCVKIVYQRKPKL